MPLQRFNAGSGGYVFRLPFGRACSSIAALRIGVVATQGNVAVSNDRRSSRRDAMSARAMEGARSFVRKIREPSFTEHGRARGQAELVLMRPIASSPRCDMNTDLNPHTSLSD
jgi:hypothetical protein